MNWEIGRMSNFYPAENIPDAANKLDKLEPGWANKIDLITLDLDTCTNCVLAQISGMHYVKAMRHYFGVSEDEDFFYENEIFGGNADLNEWTKEIQSRLGK